MKRFALLALPAFLVGAAFGAAFVVTYRRRARPAALPSRTITGPVTAATATPGAEVLAGYDGRHEEELEARHGAVLHIDVGRLNVGQI